MTFVERGAIFPATDTLKGSIISRSVGDKPVAARIIGVYWMYWHESSIFLDTSQHLIHWTPVENSTGKPAAVFTTRKCSFDGWLVEARPPALLKDSGIVPMYDSCNAGPAGDPLLPRGTNAAGRESEQLLFLEGLLYFKGRWLVYYGTSEVRIAALPCPGSKEPGIVPRTDRA